MPRSRSPQAQLRCWAWPPPRVRLLFCCCVGVGAWWNPRDGRRTALSQAPTTAVTIWSPRTRWQVAAGCSTWVGAVGCCRVWRAQPPRSPAQGAQACRPACRRGVYRAAWHVEQHSRSTTWRGRPSSITPPTARARDQHEDAERRTLAPTQKSSATPGSGGSSGHSGRARGPRGGRGAWEALPPQASAPQPWSYCARSGSRQVG